MPRLVQSIRVKSILTPASGYMRDGFDFVLTPYVGCSYGCLYCYVPTLFWARMGGIAAHWGETVLVKENAPDLLRRAGEEGKLEGKRLYLSPVTDPFLGEERRAGITKQMLQVLCDFPPDLVVIQTRSPDIAGRDVLPLLQHLGDRVVSAMSITTDREDVRRLLEPRTAPILARVAALAVLHAAGVRTQASLAPLLPCDPDALAALVAPYCDWVVAQSPKATRSGASTWRPGLKLIEARGWMGWMDGGADAVTARARLRLAFGDRYGEDRAGFNLRSVGEKVTMVLTAAGPSTT